MGLIIGIGGGPRKAWEPPYAEDVSAYGVEFDTDVSAPRCSRIGSANLHRRCPVQPGMRGCLLDDDGNVAEYLDHDDWTGADRSGARGQVMVEIPAHYRKFETEGTLRRVLLSELPLPGYEAVPLAYVSAYQATVDRGTNTLASVVNTSAQFRGGDNDASRDGTYRSLLGLPATTVRRANFRAFARKRKAGSAQWNCMTYDVQKTLYWLFVVEYATLNSQAPYVEALTQAGYRQGGLGAGVTTLDGNKLARMAVGGPWVPCGHTDSLGNRTGELPFTMPGEYDPGAESPTIVQVPRYRGVENPFGHIWQWTDGVNVRVSPDEGHGGDGLSKVYVCHDPAAFSDTGYAGYEHVGDEARVPGYVREVIFGRGGEIVPRVCQGAGSTTYHCDYHNTSIPTSAEELHGLMFGGYMDAGAKLGLACANSNNAPSLGSAYAGTRLCFLP